MDTRKRWICNGRQGGKRALLEKMEADFILDHPDAVIVRPQVDGSVVVEKPVKATEISLPAITDERQSR